MRIKYLFLSGLIFFSLCLSAQVKRPLSPLEIAELKKLIEITEPAVAEAMRLGSPDAKEMEAELNKLKKDLADGIEASKTAKTSPSPQKKEPVQHYEKPVLPKKDAARIAKMPKTILTDAELRTFLVKLVPAVEMKMNSKMKTAADELWKKIISKYHSANAWGNAASGCWITGYSQVAVWMMAKACIADPSNTDNLNNLAAFLTMTGAEEFALPVLHKLNKQYPRNSTILNNIVQAWFGLGDISLAEKYIDSTVRIYAYHSQANFTKCIIEESKGNKEAAIEALKKSIRYAYSEEKLKKLKSLGDNLKNNDLPWKFHMPQDPLGLHKIVPPAYAKSVEQADVLADEWKKFRAECWDAEMALKERDKALEKEIKTLGEQRAKFITQAVLSGKNPMDEVKPPFFSKALEKLRLELADIDGAAAYQGKKAEERYVEQLMITEQLHEQFKARVKALKEEGSSCAALTGLRNEFLKKANTIMEQAQNEYIDYLRKKINREVYYAQYMATDEPSFEAGKVNAKIRFLNSLRSLKHYEEFSCEGKVDDYPGKKLAEFDDINCHKKIEMNMIWVNAVFTCNKSKVDYNAFFFSGSHMENLNTGEIVGGTAELGIKLGLGEKNLGPVTAEIEGNVSAFIEYDKNGITDGGIKAGVSAEAGIDTDIEIGGEDPGIETGSGINLPSVGAGVETRIGWNSGISAGRKD